MDDRAGWTAGAVGGALVAGLAITAMTIAGERRSGRPSELAQLERTGAARLGLAPSSKSPPGGAEQAGVQAAHLALSALGGLAYAAAFDEDAPTAASGLVFGMGFYAACHGIAGPLLRLKPPEWRSPPAAIAQHTIVHALFGLSTALGARMGAAAARREFA